MSSLDVRAARRLALARAGLLKPEWTGFPKSARGHGKQARSRALEVIRNFGYLQLDTVSIAGARSHTIVLLSRLEGMDARLGEELLQPKSGLFEYWGHEVSWIPDELYPAFEWRRRAFRTHPWWGDLIGEHPDLAKELRRKIRSEGPLRAIEMEGRGSRGWWDLKPAKRVASALWSSGEFAIRERCHFQRTYDLRENVIDGALRKERVSYGKALETLLLKALDGHGWATTGTLSATWRFRNMQSEVKAALGRLVERGQVLACALEREQARPRMGWIRAEDFELAGRLERARPRAEVGVLLSPFDPILWDRPRTAELFGFDQKLEIFKPAAQRKYGYYCMPVLAGERLIARVDLKAERKQGALKVLSCRYEKTGTKRAGAAVEKAAVQGALERYADAVGLAIRS